MMSVCSSSVHVWSQAMVGTYVGRAEKHVGIHNTIGNSYSFSRQMNIVLYYSRFLQERR